MASAYSGQTALCHLSAPSPISNDGGGSRTSSAEAAGVLTASTTLDSYVPPKCLWSSARAGGGGGIIVYKVSSLGKVQARRLALSADNRTILLSSSKLTSRIKSVKKLFKSSTSAGGDGNATGGSPGSSGGEMGTSGVRKVDVGLLDHVQRGQHTSKFRLARSISSPLPENISGLAANLGEASPRTDALSLSLVYRRVCSGGLFGGAIDGTVQGGSATVTPASSALETLDFIVPSGDDYQALIATMDQLMVLYKRHRCQTPRDLLLLEHHWTGMGKSVDKPIHVNDWIGICTDRLGVPLSRESLQSLFDKHCEEMGVAADHGLKLGPKFLPLMESLRTESYAASTSIDPFSDIWDCCLSPPSTRVGKENASKNGTPSSDDDMTTNTFLRFLQDEQKEDTIRTDNARHLLSKVHAERRVGGTKAGTEEGVENDESSTSDEIMAKWEHITKSVFTDYLMSDANDILDPKAGALDKCDMTRPLSQYWINTSHKAFQGKHGYVNEADGAQPYIFALQRGCRCLEIDVWDGAGLHSESVVVRSKDSPKSDVGLPVQEILSAVRSFLLSVPYSYPIVLSIENNCTMPFQKKLFDLLDTILGSEGMLYEPRKSLSEAGTLPSPEDLRGKVVLKSKRPSSKGINSTVVVDDFDNNIDIGIDTPALLAYAQPDDDEGKAEEEDGVVIGFDHIGTVLSNDKDVVQKLPQELFDIAHAEAVEARAAAEIAERKSSDLQVRVNESEKQADALCEKAGISRALFEEERLALIRDTAKPPSKESQTENNGPISITSPLANVGSFTFEDDGEDWLERLPFGKEISKIGDRVGLSSLLARQDDRHDSSSRRTKTVEIPPMLSEEHGGVEVQDYLNESIYQDESVFVEADKKAAKAAATTVTALAKYEEKAKAHDDAENELYSTIQNSRDLTTAAERAATEARVNHQHAQTAKQRVATVRQLVNNCKHQAKSAETVAGTAQAEAEISAQRAEDAEKRAARAQTGARKDKTTADAETKKEEEFGKQVMDQKARHEEALINCKNARERLEAATVRLAKVEKELNEIEKSPAFRKEYGKANDDHPEDEEIVVTPGSILAKHKTKIAEVKSCLKQVKDTTAVKTSEESLLKQSRQMLEDVQEKVKAQAKIAASARRQADHSTSLAEQLAEYAEEEREAANMRKIALEKALTCVTKSTSHGSSVESQLAEAERAAEEATRLAEESRTTADNLAKESKEKKSTVDTAELEARVDELKVEKEKALLAVEAAKAVQEEAEVEVTGYKNRLANNQEILARAKKDSAEAVTREAKDKRIRVSAFLAHCKAIELKGCTEETEKETSEVVAHAAAKTTAERHAKDYLDKKIRVRPIHIPLSQATLLHSCKFRYWEKSLSLPFWHVHSISELGMLDMTSRGGIEIRHWKDFNNSHLSRVFPTSSPRDDSSSYLNPVLPWSLGCQMVSMNCMERNDSILLNDGRFRENGSCGYVLKTVQSDDTSPSQMNLDDSCPDDEVHTPDYTREIKIKVLGGSNLPKPAGVPRESVNLCVFVTLFEGETDLKTKRKTQTHITNSVRGNYFNPVWEQQETQFEVEKSSTAMMLFQVWSLSDNDQDSLIAAAAVPVSCLREGYRSVQLFDLDHTRRGAYSCASLLVHVHGRYLLSRTVL